MEEKAEAVVAPAGFLGSSNYLAVELFVDEAAEVDFVLRALAGHAGRIGELDGRARARSENCGAGQNGILRYGRLKICATTREVVQNTRLSRP